MDVVKSKFTTALRQKPPSATPHALLGPAVPLVRGGMASHGFW